MDATRPGLMQFDRLTVVYWLISEGISHSHKRDVLNGNKRKRLLKKQKGVNGGRRKCSQEEETEKSKESGNKQSGEETERKKKVREENIEAKKQTSK